MASSHENSEMSDAITNGRKMNSNFCSRTIFICIGTSILLSCVILIMSILVFSGQKSSGDPLTESLSRSSHNSRSTFDESDHAVMERFPGYFRTHKEQEMLEGSIRYNIPVNDTIDSANITIGFEKSRDTPWCVLTPAVKIFNSCCISNSQFVSPVYKVDYDEVLRKLAVFGDHKQFFRTETCSQIGACSFCLCEVEESIYSGVYDTEEVGSNTRYGVTFFKFEGSCKCFT